MNLKWKFVISTLLLIDFVIVSFSGIVLWQIELEKSAHELIKQIHIVSGIVFIILVIVHFIGNLGLYKNEFKIFTS